jgi:hypothetical protein
MITIDQLLESVDLDFEPRWITKDDEWDVIIWAEKPTFTEGEYIDYWAACGKYVTLERLKLAEFENKDCQECIYEVPRKITGKIEKLERHIRVENGYEISCLPDESEIIEKINLLIDAVNELKGK